ncbi:MAG: hypothetical protein HC845_00690 [Akkermansiaceae bacterium]|nr:hypothetical protein [Akkermansiaceae bacterium]NJR42062.1 hypothetical protein [Akkermansiaceae bacterium]
MQQAALAFVYQTLSALTAASMKLIRIGQNACQQILRKALEAISEKIEDSLNLTNYGWFNPLIEISSLRHAKSHARLFIS